MTRQPTFSSARQARNTGRAFAAWAGAGAVCLAGHLLLHYALTHTRTLKNSAPHRVQQALAIVRELCRAPNSVTADVLRGT